MAATMALQKSYETKYVTIDAPRSDGHRLESVLEPFCDDGWEPVGIYPSIISNGIAVLSLKRLKTMPHRAWETKVLVTVSPLSNANDVDRHTNQVAEEGWEPYGIYPVPVGRERVAFLFKRPKPR